MPVQNKLSLKVAMELLEIFPQNMILISVPTYELQSVKIYILCNNYIARGKTMIARGTMMSSPSTAGDT